MKKNRKIFLIEETLEKVSLKVKSLGKVTGAEIGFLYFHDSKGNVNRHIPGKFVWEAYDFLHVDPHRELLGYLTVPLMVQQDKNGDVWISTQWAQFPAEWIQVHSVLNGKQLEKYCEIIEENYSSFCLSQRKIFQRIQTR